MFERPPAGTWVTVTRPDGTTYRAMLQRYDGPQSCIAVLYSNPGDGYPDTAPREDEFYEHVRFIADPGNGAPLVTLHA